MSEKILAFFQRRRARYQQTFGTPWGKMVLSDLADFCCANRTTATSADPIQIALREGRRQVWLRIERALNLTPEEMLAIATEKDAP